MNPYQMARLTTVSAAFALFSSLALAQPPAPKQLPTGGALVGGQASISQSAGTMEINQITNRAAINWQGFSVGSNAQVNFVQPSASSVILNRIVGADASQIFGQINANGQVFLSNPNGITFAPSARVNVGGLVATTLDMASDNFMVGTDKFSRNGTTASVVNEGTIRVADYAALLAPEVRNDGIILAQNKGTVALASGDVIELQIDSSGSLLDIQVSAASVATIISNGGAVGAPGGLIILSASAANELMGSVIRNDGVLSANSMVERGGRIFLEGDDISLGAESEIMATGARGGGDVLVGGDWQGGGNLRQATTVTMEQGAIINASATDKGDGGKVVLWSEVTNADSVTIAKGDILARGGLQGGNGGKIETSGATLDVSGINVNAGSASDKAGLWLLDPYNYIIDATAATAIGSALNSSDVTVTTAVDNADFGSSGNGADVGDITLASNILKTADSGTTTLTLQASRRIDMDTYNISASAGGPLNVVLWSDYDNTNNGGISTLNNITTWGGNIWAGGSASAGGSAIWNGLTVGNGSSVGGVGANGNAMDFQGALNTSGGDVFLWGGAGSSGINGVFASANAAINAGSGDVMIRSDNFNTAYVLAITTTGNLTLEPNSTSFGATFDSNYFNFSGGAPSSLTIGKLENMADIAINSDINTSASNGAISLYGGKVSLGSGSVPINLSAGSGDITLTVTDFSWDSNVSGGVSSWDTTGKITVQPHVLNTGFRDFNTDWLDFPSVPSGLTIGREGNDTYNVTVGSSLDFSANNGAISLYGALIALGASSTPVNLITGSGDITLTLTDFSWDSNASGGESSWDTTGRITIQPHLINTIVRDFNTDWLDFPSVPSGLTIGREGNYIQNIIIGKALNIAGDVNLFGANIDFQETITTTVAGGNVSAKASGNIVGTGGFDIITNAGNITLWSDVDTNNSGYISFAANTALDSRTSTDRSNSTNTSGGGNITLSGGADLNSGYASGNGNNGITLGSGAGSDFNVDLFSGGGNILLRGYAGLDGGGDYYGIAVSSGVNINSGTGSISLYGLSDDFYALQIANNDDFGVTIQSAKTSGNAIVIDGQSSVDYGVIFNYDSAKEILATAGGAISITGAAGGNYGLFISNTDILANSGTITLDGGNFGITEAGSTPGGSKGAKVGASITSSISDINIIGDMINLGSATLFQSTGALSIKGATANTTIGLAGGAGTLNLGVVELGYIQDGFSSITIGDADAGLITSNAYTFSDNVTLQSGSNGINLAGAIDVNANNLTLNSAGAVTQGAAITAGGLELLGTGSFTLNNLGNNSATLAANSGSINYVDSDALTIGTVNTAGLTSTGTINVATNSGNLTVNESITTTDTSASALILNADRATAAGTASGGNILISGAPTVTVGAGGRATLYSGSIAGSTGLTDRIGSGSGRFRYNSDEEATNYTSAIGTGNYAVYREQPTLTINANDETVTYGTTPTLAISVTSQNGDTAMQALSTTATVAVSGTTSTSNNYTAGSKILTASGAVDQLGYGLDYTTGTLTVNQKSLTATYVGINKVYDGTANANVTGSSVDIMGIDAITFSNTAALFSDKNAGTNKTVSVSGIAIAGTDAANYTLTATTANDTTVDITQKAITVSGITAENKIYDATAVASVNDDSVMFNGMILNDALTLTSVSGVFSDKNVANDKTVALTSVYGGNDASNYTFTDQATTTANITPKAITVSGITAAAKVYDANTTASVNGTSVAFGGLVAGDALTLTSVNGAFSDKNVANGKIVTLTSVYGGNDVSNYTFTDQATTTANITPKAITVSGITVADKVYDANTTASVNGTSVAFGGMVAGDALTLTSVNGLFSDKNVANGKTVSLTSAYGGNDAGNYTFTDQATTTADITPKAITVSGITAADKVYDATTVASVNDGSVTFNGMILNDALTLTSVSGVFSDKNVANDKTVTLTSAYGGNDAGNYNITDQTNTTADILPAVSVPDTNQNTSIVDTSPAARFDGGLLETITTELTPRNIKVIQKSSKNEFGTLKIEEFAGTDNLDNVLNCTVSQTRSCAVN